MIAIATYVYILFQAAVALVMSRNKYYHDWYVQVLLLLSLPAYYAIYNFTAYILKDGLQTREKLGWKPKVTFEKLVEEMVMADAALVAAGDMIS